MQHKVSYKRLLKYLEQNSLYNADLHRYKFVKIKDQDNEVSQTSGCAPRHKED